MSFRLFTSTRYTVAPATALPVVSLYSVPVAVIVVPDCVIVTFWNMYVLSANIWYTVNVTDDEFSEDDATTRYPSLDANPYAPLVDTVSDSISFGSASVTYTVDPLAVAIRNIEFHDALLNPFVDAGNVIDVEFTIA